MKVALVIPCYRVGDMVGDVLGRVGPIVDAIYVIDDACPESTGARVRATSKDPRVRVIQNAENLGVGGSVVRGYKEALKDGAEIVVKVDGDGQMDPALIPTFVNRIARGQADYVKGNRFAAYSQRSSQARRDMPLVRWIGNNILSFTHRAVTGYWNISDPTNGFTAIHHVALRGVDVDKLDERFFFETDMLYQLNAINAVVADVPTPSLYHHRRSNLSVLGAMRDFPPRMVHRMVSRLALKYFINDFNVASVQAILGSMLFGGGAIFGAIRWIDGFNANRLNSAGTVMLAALPIILGFQLLLSAVSYDVSNVPKVPLSTNADA